MVTGCEAQIRDYEQDPGLCKVQSRLEEKITEYSTPQCNTQAIKGTRYEKEYVAMVAEIVRRVSKKPV